MKKRVVMVTGANGGLGVAIVRSFLEESPSNVVWLGVRTRRDKAEAVVHEYSDRATCIDLDVTNPESWKCAVAAVLARDQRIDVLVNNAGKHADALLATMPDSMWEEVLASNLDGVFHGCKAVLPAMISQRDGRIINISSLSAMLAPAGQANYAAAKAGALALTQSLAKEVARLNITVNAVCPGYIDTEALGGMGPEERKAALARVPMRRFGKPNEVAAAVKFLACSEASYITGSVLKIDGGIY
jgi:3-oxoacyl-[acyl-carrier protein] reductase